MIKSFLKNNPIHKKIVPYLDYLFILRPTSFFIAWPLLCIGMYIPLYLNNNIPLFSDNLSFKTIILFFSYTIMISSISIINQFNSSQDNNILNRKFSDKGLNKAGIMLFVLSVFLFLFINIIIAIISISIYLIVYLLFYFKKHKKTLYPVIWFFSMFLLCLLFIGIGTIYQLGSLELTTLFDYKLIILAIPYVLSFLSIIIINDITYSKEHTNNYTFSKHFGEKTSSFISFIFILFSLLLAIILEDPLASTSIIVFITFFLYPIIRSKNKDFIRSVRYPVGILNFFIMTIYPYLFIPSFSLFYLSKYYYWHRYDIHYPTFLVDND